MAGEGDWSKDGQFQDVKPETARDKGLGQELYDDSFDTLSKVCPFQSLGIGSKITEFKWTFVSGK